MEMLRWLTRMVCFASMLISTSAHAQADLTAEDADAKEAAPVVEERFTYPTPHWRDPMVCPIRRRIVDTLGGGSGGGQAGGSCESSIRVRPKVL